MKFKKDDLKIYFKIIISFIVIIALLFGLHFGYQYYAFDYRYRNEEVAMADYTNADPLYEDVSIMNVVSKYDSLNMSLDEAFIENSYVIPGLKQTKTLDTNGNISMCTSMTPQGICTTNEYVFISAYCHTHQHNSVIYMLNRKSHEFIKEIVLDGQYHLGNICFDSVNNNIWAACTGKNAATGRKCAYLNALSLKSIKEYQLDEEAKALHFIKKYALAEFKNASFISYYAGNIFVGVYYEGLWNESYVQRFPIDEQGGLEGTIIKGIKGKGRVVYGKEKAKISECCQGFYYTGDVIMLMQSSGPNDSKIQYFYDSKFERDINRSLQLEKEYHQYIQKKRVAENFSMQMDSIQKEINELEEQIVQMREDDNKDRSDEDYVKGEEKKDVEQQIQEVRKEIEKLQEKYDQLNIYYELSLDSVPRFDEERYEKQANSTKIYSILNEKASSEITLPPRLEQAMVSETEDYSKMYLLFESAAYSYRAQSTNVIDRILLIDFR